VSPSRCRPHVCRSFDASTLASLCDRAGRTKKPPEHISARAGLAPRFSFEPFPKSQDILTLGDFRAQYLEQRHLVSIFL
jgi:hypothetical protein